jgi:hypothetical protein
MFPATVVEALRSSQPKERMLVTAFHSTALDVGGVMGPFSFSLLASATTIPTAMQVLTAVPLIGVAAFWLLAHAPSDVSGCRKEL